MQGVVAEGWVTYRRASELTSLSRTTLWKLVSSGEVEATKIGKPVRINYRSLEEYLRQHPFM